MGGVCSVLNDGSYTWLPVMTDLTGARRVKKRSKMVRVKFVIIIGIILV